MNASDLSPARESQLDRAISEYMRRIDAGQQVDREQFVRQYPEIAGPLAEILETADAVERMAGPVTPALQPPEAADGDGVRPAAGVDETIDFSAEAGRRGNVADTVAGSGSEEEPLEPCRFGEYELLEVIGRGGMGVVYKARQVKLNRIVAVKMILTGRLASAQDIQRFYTEARAAGQIDHPNVVAIYDVGEVDGHHFFSMDYIEGTDLAHRIVEGPLEPRQAARYLRNVALAIQAAHDRGILHRDLKPANILIDWDDRVLVSDFGLAKYLDNQEGLTTTGITIGTPSFMPPEQAAGETAKMGPASDVYSMGAVLYVVLTGQPPFGAPSLPQTILDVVHKEPQPPRTLRPSADRNLETICLKCLAKDPVQRYASARELADELQRYLDGQPIQAQPAGRLRRLWNWWSDVPLLAALVGRRVLHPTVAHRRAQRALIACAILIPALLVALLARFWWMPLPLPREINLAAGMSGGMYHDVGLRLAEQLQQELGRPVHVLVTEGSGENAQRILQGEADLALVQAEDLRADRLAVVAPLYYEVVHIVVPLDSPIRSVEQIVDKSVSLGPPRSGMRSTAVELLNAYGIDLHRLRETERSFGELESGGVEVAIITSGLQNPALQRLLSQGTYRLLPLERAEQVTLEVPTLKPFHLRPEDYPDLDLPADGIPTLATTTFLVCPRRTSSRLVDSALRVLYASPSPFPAQISRRTAAAWSGLPLHAAAARLF